MNARMDCAAVLACLNEARNIGVLVEALRTRVAAVYVVDDGSSDDTAAAAARAGAEVVRHSKTRGKGAALRSGWTAARKAGFSWALTLDGDGQHAPQDADEFFECAEQTGAELVIGDRMRDTQRMPWLRRTVNRWMSRRLSVLAGRPLPDSQCGFRLLDLRVWETCSLACDHFEVESEVLLEFLRAGCRVEFVPIRVIYHHRQRSSIRPFQDSVRWFRWWLRAGQRVVPKASVESVSAPESEAHAAG